MAVLKKEVNVEEVVDKLSLEFGVKKKTSKKNVYIERMDKAKVRWCLVINPRILDILKKHHEISSRPVMLEWVVHETLKLGTDYVSELLKQYSYDISGEEEQRLINNSIIPDYNGPTTSVNLFLDEETSGRFKIMSVINDTPYQDVMRIMIFHYYSMIK